MAKGTSAMNYIKIIQGFTLFVQCGFEAPFMFINSKFMQQLPNVYIILGIYCIFCQVKWVIVYILSCYFCK